MSGRFSAAKDTALGASDIESWAFTEIERALALGSSGRGDSTLEVERYWNPGFNQDRGPVTVYGLRLHAGF
jgi:hypothetical protein